MTFARILNCLTIATLLSGPALGAEKSDPTLGDTLDPLIAAHDGEVSVAIKNLETGVTYRHEAERPMPTASLIKLPIMVTLFHLAERGTIDLNTRVSLQEDDKVPGSGLLTDHISPGASLSIHDYVRLMMRYSDNTATNIVIDQIGLPATADYMNELGWSATKLHSKVFRGKTTIFPDRSRRFGLGSTTASEMVQLLERLYAGELANEENTKAMLDHLFACEDRSKLPRFLPESIRVAHKTGSVSNCRTDAGIIETSGGPIAVCVLTNKNADRRWSDDNAAEILCGKIGEAVVARFGEIESISELRNGAFGELVESLQRTLNARLSPPPNLSVDGDFGPATEAAVRRFQASRNIDATGVVDEATWKALGTLIEHDAPVPDPDIVNAEQLPTHPETDYSKPPIVTAAAWVIADAKNGNVLAGDKENAKRAPASTTKLMTALLVAELAAKQPDVLEEVVTVSEEVDQTRGSSAKLRAGERYRVEQLLYGLLLPSGNDAAVALAHHFGPRLASDQATAEQTPLAAFVAAMNERAAELEMTQTHFANPHGLPSESHLTTASDLMTLTVHAMRLPLLEKIVSTRQYGCTTESEQGYRRNVIWKNTNRLLAIDGYHGVKTGTTSAAGACLIALGTQDGRERIVVILGSSSSAARYADTRNLFRWSWQHGFAE